MYQLNFNFIFSLLSFGNWKKKLIISNEQKDKSSFVLKSTGLLRVSEQSETWTFWTKLHLLFVVVDFFRLTTKMLHVTIKWMEWVYRFEIIQPKQNVYFHWTFYFMIFQIVCNSYAKNAVVFFFHIRWLRSKLLEYEKLKEKKCMCILLLT